MSVEKYPVQRALDVIDGKVAARLGFVRMDETTRSKMHFFELGKGGKQFAIVVYDADKVSGRFDAAQTLMLFEQRPPSHPDLEPAKEFGGHMIRRPSSRLGPGKHKAVRVGSESALRWLLDWYAQVPAAPSPSEQSNTSESPENRGVAMQATNTIFYGPPGTGKTYATARKAVELCDGAAPPIRTDLLARYEELREAKRISFVTFHQSYTYEDFVEGLRPVLTSGNLSYRIEPGVFRRICSAAGLTQLAQPGLEGRPLSQRSFFKMSLGARRDDGDRVFEECLENQCVLMGWGEDVDFTGCADKAAVRATLDRERPDIKKPDSQVQFVNILMHEVKVGDIVIASYGNRLFRGIAEVVGDYSFREEGDLHQMRAVKWLAVLESKPNVREIFDRDFAQATIYRLANEGLNLARLNELLNVAATEPSEKPYVLIIDEINRANISKVFGELITLIEPDKRVGEANAISLTLPYSGDDFGVPANLHILGTMNTADRSIALLDVALRRRFDFDEVRPDAKLLPVELIDGIDLVQLLTSLNERIETMFDRDHTIGHAYLMRISSIEELDAVFRRKVLPLLQEYFYENWSRVRLALNDSDGSFVRSVDRYIPAEPGSDEAETRKIYSVNPLPFSAAAFQRIYQS